MGRLLYLTCLCWVSLAGKHSVQPDILIGHGASHGPTWENTDEQSRQRCAGFEGYPARAGEKETRAWTIRAGMTAPQAAGVIHTDFEKGFIRAETVAYGDFTTAGGLNQAKDIGRWASPWCCTFCPVVL